MGILGVPRVPPGLVARPRLTARFEASTPLVVAYAPSGYGKTAALTQWASETSRQGVWIRAREGVRDDASLVIELGTILRDVGMIDESNPLWDVAEVASSVKDVWALALRGLRCIAGEVTLVIDDAERLDTAAAEGLIRLLVDHPPLSLRVATRVFSPLVVPTTRVVVDVDLIDRDALAFTRAEAADLLGDHADLLDAIEAHGSAPGYARLAVIRDDGLKEGWELDRYATHILHERVDRWDADLREFVLRTVLADNLDSGLASELVPGVDGRGMLHRAEREGLGYRGGSSRTQTRGFFSYAPFVRESVERIARDRLPAELIRHLLIMIARWEMRNGFPLPALRRALEAGEWELADEIVTAHWHVLLRSRAELRELFRTMTPLKLRNRPILAALIGLSLNATPQSRFRALQYFALAISGARRARTQGRLVERALLSLIETVALRVTVRYEKAAVAARHGVDAMRAMPLGDPGLGANEPSAYIHFGVSFLYADQMADAIECFDRSVAVASATGSVLEVSASSLKAGTLAIGGDVTEAKKLIAGLDGSRWPDGWFTDYPATFRHVAQAYAHLEEGEAAAALGALELTAGTLPANEHWAVLLWLRACAMVLQGRAEEAALELTAEVKSQKARKAYSPLTHDRLRSAWVLVELARGDVSAANHAMQGADAGPAAATCRARIALSEGDAGRALTELSRGALLDQTVFGGSSRTRAEHLALRIAAVALSDGDAGDVASAFERLHAFLDDRGQGMALWTVPRAALEAIDAVAGTRMGDAARARLAAAIEVAPLRAQTLRPQLTTRELAVAQELMRGGTIDEMAASLTVSPNTVKTQLRSLYRKLGVNSRTEARQALAALDVGVPTP